ncbi:MAG: SDR family NAD(P)-dependent oxidoreductase [Magnetococcus sp. WYHC-3]
MAPTCARSILISGCSSGIGLAVAEGLRRRGHQVLATARREADVQRLRAEGYDAWPLDLTNADSITAAVAWADAASRGRLYALFNNAAFGQPGALEDLSAAALRAQFETNVIGTHELTRQVIPLLRRQGTGRIILNSSILGFITLPFRGAYVASKHALEGLGDTWRLELRGTGIHVSIIQPGPIVSRFRDNAAVAFRAHVDREHSPHRDRYRQWERRFEASTAQAPEPFTLGPDAVLSRVIHALEHPRPRARYSVTFPTYAAHVLTRILPRGLLDRILLRMAG